MAARIIKGGGEVPARPLAQPPRAPHMPQGQDQKVIDREIYKARNQAETILKEGEAELAARQVQGEEAARAARQEAQEFQSTASRQEAVEAILALYKARGDRLAAARRQCLDVVNGLLIKITGEPLSVPVDIALSVIDQQLLKRRGRAPAVVSLPAQDLAQLQTHAALMAALEAVPEVQLRLGEESVLSVLGGEVPLDLHGVTLALCQVLEVEVQGLEPALEEGNFQDGLEEVPLEDVPWEEEGHREEEYSQEDNDDPGPDATGELEPSAAHEDAQDAPWEDAQDGDPEEVAAFSDDETPARQELPRPSPGRGLELQTLTHATLHAPMAAPEWEDVSIVTGSRAVKALPPLGRAEETRVETVAGLPRPLGGLAAARPLAVTAPVGGTRVDVKHRSPSAAAPHGAPKRTK